MSTCESSPWCICEMCEAKGGRARSACPSDCPRFGQSSESASLHVSPTDPGHDAAFDIFSSQYPPTSAASCLPGNPLGIDLNYPSLGLPSDSPVRSPITMHPALSLSSDAVALEFPSSNSTAVPFPRCASNSNVGAVVSTEKNTNAVPIPANGAASGGATRTRRVASSLPTAGNTRAPRTRKRTNKTVTNNAEGVGAANGTNKSARTTNGVDAPKRPKNKFFLFMAAIMPRLRHDAPHATPQDLTRQASYIWRALSDGEKDIYDSAFRADQQRYQAELGALRSNEGNRRGRARSQTVPQPGQPTQYLDAGFSSRTASCASPIPPPTATYATVRDSLRGVSPLGGLKSVEHPLEETGGLLGVGEDASAGLGSSLYDRPVDRGGDFVMHDLLPHDASFRPQSCDDLSA